jgi:hypothetical protein
MGSAPKNKTSFRSTIKNPIQYKLPIADESTILEVK